MCMLAGAPLLQYLNQAAASWENVPPDELYADQDDPLMKEWMGLGNSPGYQQEYLRELLRLEGHEGVAGECWNGPFFEDCTLKKCGLRVQLGHHNMRCLRPQVTTADFMVLHTNGIHKVAVDFCNCLEHVPVRVQCLCFHWYPATMRRPQTHATLSLLKHFHTQTLASKISAYEYYRGLCHMMDNTEVDLLKFGHGHFEEGIKMTELGTLALPCLVCPCPGVNLPEGWEKVPDSYKFLYRPILGSDMDFHLSERDKSDDAADPCLHTGLAYCVEHEEYLTHVQKYVSQKDISSCSGFRTLAHVESKNNKGLRVTGVSICVCTCHEMILPLTAGDLQISERCKEVFMSYDIACQWKPNLHQRMKVVPQKVHICEDMVLNFGVPKLHCKAHKEGVERTWDDLNLCASSTKEMGPGAWHGTINDQMGGHNWQKITCIDDTDASEVTVKHHLKEQDCVVAAAKGSVHLHMCGPTAAIRMGLMIEESQSDVESKRLLLPSDIPLLLRMERCKGDVMNVEEQLCEVQCLDALDVLRGIIRAQWDSYVYHDVNMRGQVHMTWVAAFMEHLQRRLESAAAKYRVARVALLSLRGPGAWESKLRVLTQVDMTNMEGAVFTIDLDDGTETEKTCYGKKPKRAQQQVVSKAEGYRTVSWIWTMEGAFNEADNEEVNLVVHVEWLKSHTYEAMEMEAKDDAEEEESPVRDSVTDARSVDSAVDAV
ncbi:hypothetical protein ARMGADRAFT_1029626 [Armillaria gallica]|uniref:CxC2-like cysteine cluster KDZ transposase-associated domain-containing protein n=1 Tax=Armillaria gallica TaxID=47427 RepID=A0A2H3E4F2_ARMGA|nr:hypothetical protein ARMGADRAFT_1029626 [Armillaria gallica]